MRMTSHAISDFYCHAKAGAESLTTRYIEALGGQYFSLSDDAFDGMYPDDLQRALNALRKHGVEVLSIAAKVPLPKEANDAFISEGVDPRTVSMKAISARGRMFLPGVRASIPLDAFIRSNDDMDRLVKVAVAAATNAATQALIGALDPLNPVVAKEYLPVLPLLARAHADSNNNDPMLGFIAKIESRRNTKTALKAVLRNQRHIAAAATQFFTAASLLPADLPTSAPPPGDRVFIDEARFAE